MKKRDNCKQIMSLVLTILMVLTILPFNIFAEVKRSDWVGDETTLSEDSNYWSLANKNKLIRVGLIAEPIHVPNVNFIGMYYTKDDQGNERQVLRFTFNKFQTAQSGVWKRLVLKFNKKLYDAVDWDNLNTGIYKDQQFNSWDDHPNYAEKGSFYSINSDPKENVREVGDKYVKWVDLQDYRLNTGSRGRYKIPFDLMLKEGQDIKKFNDDILIQLRLYNFDWTKVYTKSNVAKKNEKSGIPYNNYTFTTFVPVKTDIKWTLQNEVACPSEAPFKACDVYLSYNEDEGYIDVVHKQGKDGSGNVYFGDPIGFFESFETKFKNILREDNRGVVGKIFVTNHHDNPVNNISIDIYKDMINDDTKRGISFIQFASANGWWGTRLQYKDPDIKGEECDLNNPSKYPIKTIFNDQDESDRTPWPNPKREKNSRSFIHSVLNAGTSGATSGTGTVVRYYVDKEKVNKTFDEGGLNAFAFFGAFLRRPYANNAVTKAVFTMKGDQYLTKGTQVNFEVNQPLDPFCRVNLCIGKDQFKLYFRDSIEYAKDGGRYRTKQFTWTVPYNILIKEGTPITVSTKVGQKKIFRFPNKLPTSMTVNGLQVLSDNVSCKEDYTAKIIPYTESISGGAIAKTYYTPKVDEIFTDSNSIDGYSFYGGAEVSIGIPVDNNGSIENKIQKIASNESIEDIYTKSLDQTAQTVQAKHRLLTAHKYQSSTPNPNPNNENKYSFSLPTLTKDAPIIVSNRNIDSAALDSKHVVEQVQTKFNFNLNGKKSAIDGRDTIEKIVPLNKEYSYSYDTDKKIFTKNPNYQANGFSATNSKVATTNKAEVEKVEVEQELPGGKKIKRTVTNYLDHCDETYDINLTTNEEEIKKEIEAKKQAYEAEKNSINAQIDEANNRKNYLQGEMDKIKGPIKRKKEPYISYKKEFEELSATLLPLLQEALKEVQSKLDAINAMPADIADRNKKIKQKAIADLIKRQMPISDEVKSDKGENIIGWTTKPLKDTAEKSQADQFYELEEKENSKIKTLDDWKKVDGNSNDNYIFDENSPVDKERTVYAVYGTPSVVLHSGINDKNGKEIIVRLPITDKDLRTTSASIDAWSKATPGKLNVTDLKNVAIFKKIPKAPYLGDEKRIAEADPLLKEFKKENHTFIGWNAVDPDDLQGLINPAETLKNKLNKFDAGQNNEHIEKMENEKGLPRTEELNNIWTNPNYYLPNGYTLYIKTTKLKGKDGATLKNKEEFFKKGQDIHLYAIYRPYFDVTVNPRYMTIDRTADTEHEYGKYVDNVEQSKKKGLKIGLLTRTAVTGYGTPTVAANANYNPIGDIVPKGQTVLQDWQPNGTSPTWKVPGYDELGQRKSYVSIIVESGKDETYRKFGQDFNTEKWKELGITTYLKLSGASFDANAPRNLHETVTGGDPYGVNLAKTQSFVVTNGADVDTFTSATSRTVVKDGDSTKEEIKGYNITMTNSLEQIPKPKFDRIRDRDKEVTLHWPEKGYKDNDYKDINKIQIDLQTVTKKGKNTTKDIKNYTFVKNTEGKYVLQGNGNLTLKIYYEKIHLSGSDLTLKYNGNDILVGQYITAHYIKETTTTTGTSEIKTKTTEPIVPIKTSKQVKDIRQMPKRDENSKTTIKFVVPTDTLDQVSKGSKYIAQKWDNSQKKWVKVGEKILGEVDKINNQYQGNSYDIGLTNVNDGDIVRIVSYENNPLAKNDDSSGFYTKEETEKGAEDGFSLPNYSTTTNDGEANADGEPVRDVYKENKEYVIIDLKGPEINPIAKDESFRRFIDITGQLNEVPEGKLLLEIGEKDKDNYQSYEFDSKEKLIEFVNTIPRLDNMPAMKITAVDEMGNASTTDVEYTHEKQIRFEVLDCRKRRKDVNIKCDVVGATVTATVYNAEGDLTVVASGSVEIEKADTFTKLTIYKADDTSKTYRLKKGNLVRFTAEKKDSQGKVEYRANPMDILIK